MRKAKKTLLAALLLASSIRAEEAMTPGYNAPCRIKTENSWNLYLWGSFTYFQPIQENMILGVLSNSTNAADLVNGREIDLDFDYKPGFKVGIGAHLNYDDWDTEIEYTWFRGTESVQKKVTSNLSQIAILPAWEIPNFLNPQYNYGSESWSLKMDLINWDLLRNYFVGQKLCFSHFIGLRYALIRQKLEVDYLNTNLANFFIWPSTSVEQSTRSWAIGPRMGLRSSWHFCDGFRLFCEGEFDILFTQYNLHSKQSSAVLTANEYLVKSDDANYLRTHTGLCLGLGWGRYFSCNRYHFDLSADYGFEVFFDQNMFRTPVSAQAVGKSFLPNGNLYLQGLTITAKLDF